jgi:hypothetical protein
MDLMQERTDANLDRMEALVEANNEKSDISFIFVLHCFLAYFTRWIYFRLFYFYPN